VRPLSGQMAAQGVRKRRVLFGVGWHDEKYQRLCPALVDHPWRLPKKVTCAFDWLSTQISEFCTPDPNSHPAATSTVVELQWKKGRAVGQSR